MPNVLITGGSGLVGTRLTQMLQAKGYSVAWLSRDVSTKTDVKVYQWDLSKGYIDPEALAQADYLVHLAGAGIADKSWTNTRKQELIHSRTASISLISQKLSTFPHKLKAFVSASGIGYYGADTGDTHITEESNAGNDFLAEICKQWEASADQIGALGIRTTKLRIGIVLSDKGGALPKFLAPMRMYAGSPLGTGKQWQSWIHIDDLCRLFIESLENPAYQGVYNAVAPQPITNAQLNEAIAQMINRPMWLPNVPGFVLKLIFGEMANIILGGNFIKNQKLSSETSFQYKFSDIKVALKDLLG
jgi:uncharacterized protein